MIHIKDCFLSGKFFSWKPDCVLESKRGEVSFKLNVEKAKLAKIYLKKNSGNGNFIVRTSWYSQTYCVSSIIVEEFFFILPDDGNFQIIRSNNGLGEIAVLGIDLLNNTPFIDINEELSLGQESLIFKSIFANFSSYSGIKLNNGKLYASSGALIKDNGLINSIASEPPNAFQKIDDGWKSLFSCRILNLNLREAPSLPRVKKPPFVHQPVPAPVLNRNQIKPEVTTNKISTLNSSKFQRIFDSTSNADFSKISFFNKKLAKIIVSNGQSFLLLRKGGKVKFSSGVIQSGVQFNFKLSGKKINGNGRCHFIVENENKIILDETLVFSNGIEVKSIPITLLNNSECNITLSVSVDDGFGEVLFSSLYLENTMMASTPVEEYNEEIIVNFDRSGNKKFVIVIPSYNNLKWCERNIQSALTQNYNNYRVIFTDDCSSDGTFEKVSNIVRPSKCAEKITLIKNPTRLGALANLYNMICSCADDEIILTLDGDDWLAHPNVLNKLNEVYSNGDIWMTYGQYQNYPDRAKGISRQIPESVIKQNTFRGNSWCASHLRTFYAWLFKKIKKEDLFYQGNFMAMTWDMAMMFPMLEMSGYHSKFVSDVLYIYNLDNPINDHKVNVKLQQDLDHYVRNLPKYRNLEEANLSTASVGLILIATGKYHKFIKGLISSADKFFLNGVNVTYYLFSDKTHKVKSKRSVVNLHVDHVPFPYASMNRFKYMIENADKLKEDYLFYVDVDSLFVNFIGTEILGDLVGVQHCGFFNLIGPFENNPISNFYVSESEAQNSKYFGGGFSGGKKEKYLELAQWCKEKIDDDLNRGILPVYHDESAINRYFIDHKPDIILDPGFHYPQSGIERYKKIWGREFSPRILLLDKNHSEVRS